MKTVEEIYEEMLAVFRQETGAEAGATGDLAVKLYAVAAQVYGLYAQAEWLSRQCFPQTAEGEWLARHAALRGLERRSAARAEGKLRFSVENPLGTDVTVPAGTVCATAGMVRFETTEGGVIPAGETGVEIPARAVEAGTGGNVPAGSILVLTAPPVGVGSCVNPAAFAGGTGEEGDEELRERVLETFRRMPNGANAAFYQQGALSFERVCACTVIPRSRGVGTVDVIVTEQKGLPEEELLGQLREYFEERREIAVDVAVKAPTTKQVDVEVKVTADENGDTEQVKETVEKTLREYFSGERLSEDILPAKLNQLVFSVEGVVNCKVKAPAEDVKTNRGELPRLGTLSVEVTAE